MNKNKFLDFNNINLKQVKEIISRSVPNLHILTIIELAQGWCSIAFDIDNSWIARFPRDDYAFFGQRKEAHILDYLNKHIKSALIPQPKLYNEKEGYPFSLHKKLTGKQLLPSIYNNLSQSKKTEIIETLTDFFIEMHNLPIEAVEKITHLNKLWIFVRDHDASQKSITDHFSKEYQDFLFSIRDWYLNYKIPKEDLIFGHFDTHNLNTLYDRDKHQLSIIDFGDVAIDDIHRDFSSLFRISYELCKNVVSNYITKTNRNIDFKRVQTYGLLTCMSNLESTYTDKHINHDLSYLKNNIKFLSDELTKGIR